MPERDLRPRPPVAIPRGPAPNEEIAEDRSAKRPSFLEEPRAAVTCIITLGMLRGPITTRREAGESLVDSIARHRAALMSTLPTGERLMTTWQTPIGQEVVTTVRRDGESDEGVRERHVLAFSTR